SDVCSSDLGVMEEGEVDPSRTEEHRLAPRAFKRRRRHEIVLDVLVVPIDGADDRVGQPESSVAIAQAGGPYTSGVRHPTQVEVREGMTENRPVDEVATVVQTHCGMRFEGAGGHVVVVSDAHDGRIGVEAAKDRIVDLAHALTS